MRKYACLREPFRYGDHRCIYKIMLYGSGNGYCLFEYSAPDAVMCSSDRYYDSLEDLYDDWNDLIDEKGWITTDDPLPYCQHDALIPVRVKGRDTGQPEWGKFEMFQDGQWIDMERQA